jgi:hypothetical protein
MYYRVQHDAGAAACSLDFTRVSPTLPQPLQLVKLIVMIESIVFTYHNSLYEPA